MSAREDLSGRKFGKLTVLGPAPEKLNGRYAWIVQCECCAVKKATSNALLTGHTRSCGCVRIRKMQERRGRFARRTT